MGYTENDQIDYLVKKVIGSRKKVDGNLLTELSDEQLGAILTSAVLDAPIPGTNKRITCNDEFSESWTSAISKAMFALLCVVDEVKDFEEVKNSVVA